MKTGIVKDNRFMKHNPGNYHVENPKRLEVIYEMLEKDFPSTLEIIPPRPATEEEICLVHTRSHYRAIKSTREKERTILDMDTSTSPNSFEAACLAAGGVLAAEDKIMAGEINNGFALVRPPGHHAEAAKAMGFCFFNNIAVGAQYLRKKHGLNRILIVDWDVHHGNGTQNAFYETDEILYFSLHQFPHYPGTGHFSETGKGRGEGYTVNIPLSGGKTNSDYFFIFEKILKPSAEVYKPQFILVSAGFDPHQDDPLSSMLLTSEGFAAMTLNLMEIAEKWAEGRLLIVLEGGYALEALRKSVRLVLLCLCGEKDKTSLKAEASPQTESELTQVFENLKKF